MLKIQDSRTICNNIRSVSHLVLIIFQIVSTTSPPNRVASPKQMLPEGNCIINPSSNSSKLKCNGPQSDPRSDLLKAIRDGNIDVIIILNIVLLVMVFTEYFNWEKRILCIYCLNHR